MMGVEGENDQDQIGLFTERFSEFNEQYVELTVEEYLLIDLSPLCQLLVTQFVLL